MMLGNVTIDFFNKGFPHKQHQTHFDLYQDKELNTLDTVFFPTKSY